MSKYMSIENDECAICKDPLKDHETSELDCNHIFHNKCVKQSVMCPYCRGPNKYNEISVRTIVSAYTSNVLLSLTNRDILMIPSDFNNNQSIARRVIAYANM